MVMPQEVFERIELDITLIDVNDNSPHFPQSSVQVDIAEGQTTRVISPGYSPPKFTFSRLFPPKYFPVLFLF